MVHEWLSNLSNPLLHNTTLDISKLKAYVDDKLDMTQTIKFAADRQENIKGKGEKAGYQYFM